IRDFHVTGVQTCALPICNPGVTTSLKRGDLSAGVNIGIPITSRREDFGAAIGDVSLNFQGGVNHLSDFGTLTDWTAGINWGVTETGRASCREAGQSELAA